ncbi:MAG: radical SAM protein [Clostridia bacterium]|nr:radical SAM protein [Clostridia bacterium]
MSNVSTEPLLLQHLFSKAVANAVPISGTFELTARCNLSCKMCYVHLQQSELTASELSADEWVRLAEEACEQGMLLALLTGGEPLLRPDFTEIYARLKQLGIVISINTNGTLIDGDMLEYFLHNPPYRINMSVYGASPATYERLCGNANAYYRATDALKRLIEHGIDVKVNLSVTQHNLDDALDIYRMVHDLGAHVQAATYMFPPVRRSGAVPDRMTPEQSARTALDVDRLRFGDAAFAERLRRTLDGITPPDPDRECFDLPSEPLFCRAGRCTFWLTWDGRMLPCGMMETPVARPLEQGFSEAWKHVHAQTRAILLPAECTACPKRHACEVCAASCYTETGAFDGVPRYMCARTDATLAMAGDILRLLEGQNAD